MMISYIATIVTLLICCQAISTSAAAELSERRLHLLNKSLRRHSSNNNADHNRDSSDDTRSKKSNRIANHLINKRQLLDREEYATVEDEQLKKREIAPHLLSSFWDNDLPSADSSQSRRLTNINEIITYMKMNYEIDLIEVQTNEIPSRTKISAVDGSTFSYGNLIDGYEDVVYLVAANQEDFALLVVHNMNSSNGGSSGGSRVMGVARLYNGELVKIQQQQVVTPSGGGASEEGSNGHSLSSWKNSLLDWDTWHNNQLAEVDTNKEESKIVVTPYDGVELVESDCAEIYTDDTIGSQEEGKTNAIHSWSNSLNDSWDSWIEDHQAASDEINSSTSSSGLNGMKSKDTEDEAASFLQQIQHNKHTNVSPMKKKSDQDHRYKHVHSDNRHLMEEDKISTATTTSQQQVQLYFEIDSINVQDDDSKTITKNVDYRSILASTTANVGGDNTNEEDTGNNDMKCIYIPASAVYGNDITWSGSIIYMKQTTIPPSFDSEGTDSGLVLDNGTSSSATTTSSPTTSTPSLSLVPSDSTQPSSQPSDSTVPSLSSLPSSQPSQQPSYVPSESSMPR